MTAIDADDELIRARTKIENLRTALRSSRIIAIALGIVMERLTISEGEAFALLRAISQTRHRKIREIASEIVFSGEIPAPGPPR